MLDAHVGDSANYLWICFHPGMITNDVLNIQLLNLYNKSLENTKLQYWIQLWVGIHGNAKRHDSDGRQV